MELNKELLNKYDDLKAILASYGSVAVAFSGGVDSAFLMHAAHEALGGRALALTASSRSFPERELNEAVSFCRERGIRQVIIESEELSAEGFAQNPKNRCYICKKQIFTKFLKAAGKEGMKEVAEGSNLDDNGDYRPGLMAVAELGIRSPLRESGFTKEEIRILSRHFGLPTWDKQSFACLASRFPYGEIINEKKLAMVDQAEQYLLDLGFRQLRVRIHGGNMARIELLPEDFQKFMSEDIRIEVYEKLIDIGFTYVSLDLKGYRTGSMNETIRETENS